MLIMHRTDHLSSADSEDGAGSNSGRGGQTQPGRRRERLFTHKVAGGKKRDGGFFPGCGNHRDLCTALLKIKNRVRGISLRKDGFLWRKLDNLSPQAGVRQEGSSIESGLSKFNH